MSERQQGTMTVIAQHFFHPSPRNQSDQDVHDAKSCINTQQLEAHLAKNTNSE